MCLFVCDPSLSFCGVYSCESLAVFLRLYHQLYLLIKLLLHQAHHYNLYLFRLITILKSYELGISVIKLQSLNAGKYDSTEYSSNMLDLLSFHNTGV